MAHTRSACQVRRGATTLGRLPLLGCRLGVVANHGASPSGQLHAGRRNGNARAWYGAKDRPEPGLRMLGALEM